jgi:hypothetical protein
LVKKRFATYVAFSVEKLHKAFGELLGRQRIDYTDNFAVLKMRFWISAVVLVNSEPKVVLDR